MVSGLKWDLKYFETGEYQVVEERLKDLGTYVPGKRNLFAALRACPYERTKVVFLGQDPYPNPKVATGLAFSIPKESTSFPPTLTNILKEYKEDLHYPSPLTGDLSKWSKEGVLLWNVIPSTSLFKSLDHYWEEWFPLTEEILNKLVGRDIIFVFFGSVAQGFIKYLPPWEEIIPVSHPSPRASLKAKNPFFGSRIFTKINSILVSNNKPAIDWRLP
jgi:uracil-DNA glycosylase